MDALKDFRQECIESASNEELIDLLLTRINLDAVPTEKLVQLSNVLECEHVTRLSRVHTYADDNFDGA